MTQVLKQAILIMGVFMLLLLVLIYPFLPGKYDPLALPMSTVVQVAGAVGLLLSLIGAFWLIFPKRQRLFLKTAMAVCATSAALISLLAFGVGGKIMGISILGLWLCLFLSMRSMTAKTLLDNHHKRHHLPVYLISLPLMLMIFQVALAKPVKKWSRDRCIHAAREFIADIENFRAKYNYYPKTLQAMYQDYFPQTVGVEKYHYLPFGDSYNLSFEQPRFLFDIIGTKEWVVYNPKGEHRVYSHTSWLLLLPPAESEQSQGWYASGETGHIHWKYFLFD